MCLGIWDVFRDLTFQSQENRVCRDPCSALAANSHPEIPYRTQNLTEVVWARNQSTLTPSIWQTQGPLFPLVLQDLEMGTYRDRSSPLPPSPSIAQRDGMPCRRGFIELPYLPRPCNRYVHEKQKNTCRGESTNAKAGELKMLNGIQILQKEYSYFSDLYIKMSLISLLKRGNYD